MSQMIYVFRRTETARVRADGPRHAALELMRLYGWDAEECEVELIDRKDDDAAEA